MRALLAQVDRLSDQLPVWAEFALTGTTMTRLCSGGALVQRREVAGGRRCRRAFGAGRLAASYLETERRSE